MLKNSDPPPLRRWDTSGEQSRFNSRERQRTWTPLPLRGCSTDGLTWTNLGAGTRRAGGWELAVASSPLSGVIRARGCVTGGRNNGSGWFVETQLPYPNPPTITVSNVRLSDGLILTNGLAPASDTRFYRAIA